jgi:hypothetical protein
MWIRRSLVLVLFLELLDVYTIAMAIRYAVGHGAQVIKLFVN